MAADLDDENPARLSDAQRIALLERDARDHARSLTELVKAGRGFSDEQIAQIRNAFREELASAGLRLDEPEHQDEARRDFMFLRSFRQGVNGTAAKIGWMVIAAVAGAVIWLVNSGLAAWRAG